MRSLLLHDFELDEDCYKVRLLLAALGLACEKAPVNMIPGAEQTRAPLLLLNPLGALPILEDRTDADEPLVLRDAEAILPYLAARYDSERRWLPEEPRAFGQVMSWLVFAARDLHAAVLARRCAMFDDAADGPAMMVASRRAFHIMEDHMAARRIAGADWFVGNQATLADIAVWPSFALSRDFSIEHDAFPSLRRWARRMRTIPHFITMPGIPDYH